MENGRQKTMRQNQKINEALFQQQDLCTVNITLAISGNPITLHLSFLFWQGTGGGRQKERERVKGVQKSGQRENKKNVRVIFSVYFQKLKIKRGGAETKTKKRKKEGEPDALKNKTREA